MHSARLATALGLIALLPACAGGNAVSGGEWSQSVEVVRVEPDDEYWFDRRRRFERRFERCRMEPWLSFCGPGRGSAHRGDYDSRFGHSSPLPPAYGGHDRRGVPQGYDPARAQAEHERQLAEKRRRAEEERQRAGVKAGVKSPAPAATPEAGVVRGVVR